MESDQLSAESNSNNSVAPSLQMA